MRFTIRDLLWLIVVVGLAIGWCYHSTSLWIGKAMAEEEMQRLSDEIKRLRAELADVKPDKIYPGGAR